VKLKKKIFLWVAIVVVAVVVVALVGRNLLIKQGLQSGVKKSLGTELAIGKINVGLLRSDIRVEGLTVYNPEGFEGELAALPLIFVDYELAPMFKDRIHLSEVEVNINEIAVVKNKNGEVNLTRLKPISEKKDEEKAPEEEKPKKEWEMQIDRLLLTIDHIKFVDYSAGGEPEVVEIPIGIDREEFRDLDSMDEIVQVVVLRVILKAGLANIGIPLEDLAVDLGGLKREDIQRLKDLTEKGTKAVENAQKKAEELLEKLKGVEKE
jgi:uncharacterized protein involved in outer membrane biogenesis